jgi:hypothetical protein
VAVYPCEPTGGAWVALNDRGLGLALINWYAVDGCSVRSPISRGQLLVSLLDARGPGEIQTALEHARDHGGATLGRRPVPGLSAIRPFRLIAVSARDRQILEWRWDQRLLVSAPCPWQPNQWVSSGFDERAAQQVRGATFRNNCGRADAGTIAWVRALHASHEPEPGPFSICMHRADARSVSYTEIEVRHGQGMLRHANSPPCEAALQDMAGIRVELASESP